MTLGRKYYFRYTATNSVGTSEFSDESVFALAALPLAPTAPVKNAAQSTLTSIYVTWPLVADADVNTLGYRLYMDSGNDGNFSMVMDGNRLPGVNYYNATSLATSHSYQFKVSAINFNGEGPTSPSALYYSCLAPE